MLQSATTSKLDFLHLPCPSVKTVVCIDMLMIYALLKAKAPVLLDSQRVFCCHSMRYTFL